MNALATLPPPPPQTVGYARSIATPAPARPPFVAQMPTPPPDDDHARRVARLQALSLGSNPDTARTPMTREGYLWALARLLRIETELAASGHYPGQKISVPNLLMAMPMASTSGRNALLFFCDVADGPYPTPRNQRAAHFDLTAAISPFDSDRRRVVATWAMHPYFPPEDGD